MFHLRDQPLSSCQRWKRGNEWQHDQCSSENNEVEADTTYLSGDKLCKQPRIRSKHWHQWRDCILAEPRLSGPSGSYSPVYGFTMLEIRIGPQTPPLQQHSILYLTSQCRLLFATVKWMSKPIWRKSKLNNQWVSLVLFWIPLKQQTNTDQNQMHSSSRLYVYIFLRRTTHRHYHLDTVCWRLIVKSSFLTPRPKCCCLSIFSILQPQPGDGRQQQ